MFNVCVDSIDIAPGGRIFYPSNWIHPLNCAFATHFNQLTCRKSHFCHTLFLCAWKVSSEVMRTPHVKQKELWSTGILNEFRNECFTFKKVRLMQTTHETHILMEDAIFNGYLISTLNAYNIAFNFLLAVHLLFCVCVCVWIDHDSELKENKVAQRLTAFAYACWKQSIWWSRWMLQNKRRHKGSTTHIIST